MISQPAITPLAQVPSVQAVTNTTPLAQGGGAITVFGPRTYISHKDITNLYVDQFTLPGEATAPYTMTIQNGGPGNTNPVTSVRVRLNGVDLWTPPFLTLRVASLTRKVSLATNNTLEVTLIGPLGSSLSITIQATRGLLDSVAPARATQGQTLSVTLRGKNTNWVPGQTRASFGGEVSVGGAAYGDFGLMQVTDWTTAVAQITVSPTAALAPRTVRVVTPVAGSGDQTVALVDAFTVSAASPPGATSASVSTFAGAPGGGFADGNAAAARFHNLTGIAVGPDDAVYVADAGNHRIRRVAVDGTVTTFAGDGAAGFADGAAATARFNNPQGVAVDANGVVYVADTANHRIRRITTDGTVTTLAGNGTPGLQDGLGAGARFNAPRSAAVDNLGNVYVADTGNSAVRVINAAGQVQTVAGDGTIGNTDSPARFNGLAGVAFDGGRLFIYLADTNNHRIRQLMPGGAVITLAGAERGFADGTASEARFAEPSGIAADGSGRLIVTDAINSLVRSVHPERAINGEAGAVMTIAGTGERWLTDGAGNVARFFTPRGVTVMASSAIIVADTGNRVLRRILLPPIITSITPSRARVLETVTINGERFDGRLPDRNVVRFTRTGGGQIVAQVTAATRTQLTVIVPKDAVTGPVTVQTEGGLAISLINFEVITAPPIITDFMPKKGPVGTLVTLTGTTLKVDANDPTVTFTGSGSARVSAPLVLPASATEVRVRVPSGAVTGPIELTNAAGRAVTPDSFIVEVPRDFQLTVSPTTVTAPQGSTATYIATVTSTQATFTQLATLSVTGAPAGVTASFNPRQITAGASSTLSLVLSGALSPSSYSFRVCPTKLTGIYANLLVAQ